MTSTSVDRLSMILSVAAATRYARAPIPSDEDSLLEELVAAVEQDQDRGAALGGFVRGQLQVFALRSASRAVRESNPRHVTIGLGALCLGAIGIDASDVLPTVCALMDSCRRNNIDPIILRTRARNPSVRKAAEMLLAVPPEALTLEAYKIGVSMDPDGFRYTPVGSGVQR